VGCGFGGLALAGLLADEARSQPADPLAPKAPHFPGRARHVIFLFMHGGVSHVDTFDPKPELERRDGQALPGAAPVAFAGRLGALMRSPWKFRNHGQSGLPVSDLFPHIGSVIDDIAVVRSMKTQNVAHAGAVIELHTGSGQFIRPSMGSWVVYGLGTENASLPGFISFGPPDFQGGAQNYGAAFLPATFQGTAVGNHLTPIARSRISNLERAEPTDALQRRQLDLIQQLNRDHQQIDPADTRLEARIQAYELAFRMQDRAPEAMDLAREPDRVLGMYGIDGGPTDNFGRQCLMARRLIERGVRFVQCNHSYKWDQHAGLVAGHTASAREVDQPVAALIKDLKQRGLLDETLIVWGTEFGRTPVSQGDGRDHNPYGFSVWLAGGGVKGGVAHGATDDFGYHAIENVTTMHDLHATILHLLGFDHTRLTYRHAGRDYRLTDVHGEVMRAIVA
jgi:hypothetical protein